MGGRGDEIRDGYSCDMYGRSRDEDKETEDERREMTRGEMMGIAMTSTHSNSSMALLVLLSIFCTMAVDFTTSCNIPVHTVHDRACVTMVTKPHPPPAFSPAV